MQKLELFLCVIILLWYFALHIPIVSVARSLLVQFSETLVLYLDFYLHQNRKSASGQKAEVIIFLISLKDHIHTLSIVQCLKTVISFILSRPIVVYSGRTSTELVTP